MGGKVQAVEPIRREDFNSNARGTNFSTPPNESLPTTRGSLIDFYA